MESDDEFAHWAKLFASHYSESKPRPVLGEQLAPSSRGVQYTGITPAAGELLRAVDAGGVPAFVTGSLKQIAEDNGIAVGDQWTPNEIIEAIREKASIDSTERPVPPD
ncbi:MAG: hypothetical protein WCV99_02140 [Sterolibacterium sp.]|jgi:hypothetical protein